MDNHEIGGDAVRKQPLQERIHVRIDGPDEAPALLLSNSLGTNLGMWDPQIPALSKRFRVIRYDSRGHGASAAPDRPYSIPELAGDALAVLDAVGVAKAHFVGLSMGGMVGMWLMTHHADRLGRVVLANTSPHMGPASLWNERIRAVRGGGMSALVESILARWFTGTFRQRDPAAIERVADMLRATPPQGYAACCAAIRDMDQREPIRGVRGEALVIVGEHDPSTTPAVGRTIADSIPGARLVSLPAAHLSNIEAPEAFTKAVLDFLTAPTRAASAKGAAGQAAGKKAGKKTVKAAGASAGRKAAGKAAKSASTPAAGKAGKAGAKTTASAGKAAPKAARKAGAAARKSTGAARKSANKSARKAPRRGGGK